MSHKTNCRQVSLVFLIMGIILLMLKINFGFLYLFGSLISFIWGEN